MFPIEEKDPGNSSRNFRLPSTEEVELEIQKEYVSATLVTISGLRIAVNWVEKSTMDEIRKYVAKDFVVHGEDFSVNMREVCFVQVHEIRHEIRNDDQ